MKLRAATISHSAGKVGPRVLFSCYRVRQGITTPEEESQEALHKMRLEYL